MTAPDTHTLAPVHTRAPSRIHVREPYELPPDDRAAFWANVLTAAQAVATLLRPKKMNYEIHGNTVAHLHMHLFPRFDGDPFEGRPIDGRKLAFERTDEQLGTLAAAIAQSAHQPE
jgi:diadenosine tetraphosphate (Ap4A) HIT family hydrolase